MIHRPLCVVLSCAVLGGASTAQTPQGEPAYQEGPVVQADPLRSSLPPTEIELALSDDFAWFALRTPYELGDGTLTLEVLGDEDNNFVARGHITRFSPAIGNPQVSVGLGLYAGVLDLPGDNFVMAAPLSVGGRYQLPKKTTHLPVSFEAWGAWAPDITSFEGADELIDLHVRAEVGIGDSAAFFVGWRRVEFDVGAIDAEVGDSFVVGVSLSN